MDELIALSTSATIKTALEYGELSMRQSLLEIEVDRVSHILNQASSDPVLNFWIDQIDYCVGCQLGLMNLESQVDFGMKQVMLGKHLAALLDNIGQDANL